MNSFIEEMPEDHGIVVFAEYVGTCGDPIPVTPEPLAMPAFLTLASYSFKIPNIDPDRYFFYNAMGVAPDGGLYQLFGGGDLNSWDFAGCTNAVLVRGSIVERPDLGGYAIDPCPDSCWYTTSPDCLIDFDQAQTGWEAFVGTGIILDFHGLSYTIGLLGAPCAFISHFEVVIDPAGCEAVPNDALSWGSLKAQFR